MLRSAVPAVLALALLVVSTQGFPEQQAPSPAGKAPLSIGPTYDEIVVETQLAVRPKVASAGLSLRSGRAKAAKAVYFRPNATTSSGTEVRRITPLAAAPKASAPGDGVSFAARVVSEENPLAVERARKAAAAAAAARTRRESSFSSSSSSFRSSSSSSEHGEHSGPAAPRSAAPTATSHSSSSSSRTYSQQLADGRIVTVTDDFQSSLGSDTKTPTASRLLSVLVSGH